MASVTYGKCYLWQKYYVKCNYGKNIMANETEPNECSVLLYRKLAEGPGGQTAGPIGLKLMGDQGQNRLNN